MSWAIMIVSFGLVKILWDRKKFSPWWLKTALLFIGGCSLADVVLGVWLANTANGIVGILPGPSSVYVGAATLIVLALAIYDIAIDKKVDKVALFCVPLLPVLFLAGVGPLAEAGSGLTDSVAEVSGNSIGRVIGGGN